MKIEIKDRRGINLIPEVAEISYIRDLEISMSELYLAMKKSTGKYPEFWDRIAEEEIGHSEILESLSKSFLDGDVSILKLRFSIPAIEESRFFVEKKKELALSSKIPIADALEIAENAELRTIDAVSFQIFEGLSEEAGDLLRCLADGSKSHLERVRKMRHYVGLPLISRLLIGCPWKGF